MKYKAFISYKHTFQSQQHASLLESALKKYAKPLLEFPIKIFRDEESMTPSIDLDTKIKMGLGNADYFIYLATTEAAQSPWIGKEATYWINTLERLDKIVIVHINGKISSDIKNNKLINSETDAIHPAILNSLSTIPLYIDLSWVKDVNECKLTNPKYKKIIRNLSAHLRGISPEDMDGKEVNTTARNIRLKNGALAILTLLTISTALATLYANIQRSNAEIRIVSAQSRNLLSEDYNNASVYALAATGRSLDSFASYLPSAIQRVVKQSIATPLPGAINALSESIQLDRDQQSIHLGNILWSFAISPNHKMVVAGDEKGIIYLWRIDQNNRIWKFNQDKSMSSPITIQAHQGTVSDISFSKDSSFFATSSSGNKDKTVKLWHVDGKPLGKPFDNHSLGITSIKIHPTGKFVASSSYDKQILFSDMNGNQVGDPIKHDGPVFDVDFNPSGEYMMSVSGEDSSNNRRVLIWDTSASTHPPSVLSEHEYPIIKARFSQNNNWIATGDDHGGIYIWDRKSLKLHSTNFLHKSGITSLSFDDDSMKIASGSSKSGWDLSIILSDLEGRQIGGTLKGSEEQILDVEFIDQNWLMSLDLKALRIWSLNGFLKNKLDTTNDDGFPSAMFTSSNNQMISTGVRLSKSRTNDLIQWDLDANKAVPIFESNEGFMAAAANIQGDIVGALMQRIRLKRLGQNEEIVELPNAGNDLILSLDISSDGKRVAVGTSLGSVHLYDVAMKKWIQNVTHHPDTVYFVKFNPYKPSLIVSCSGTSDSNPKLIKSGKLIVSDISKMKLSNGVNENTPPDGIKDTVLVEKDMSGQISAAWLGETKLLSGGTDGAIYLWAIAPGESGRFLSKIYGHKRAVKAIAVNNDSLGTAATIASGDVDGVLMLHDVSSYEPLANIKDHLSSITSVSFSPDGNTLASTYIDGKIMLWHVNLHNWISMSCERLSNREAFPSATDAITLSAKNTCCQHATPTGKYVKFCN